MINYLVLIKAYNTADFKYWYSYHKHLIPTARFVFLDNESAINLFELTDKKDIILPIVGFPDQHNLYNKIFNNSHLFSDGDYVIIIDDDEYLYFHDKNDNSHSCFVEDVLRQAAKPNLLVPQVLISQPTVPDSRPDKLPLPYTHIYRRNDLATTCKSIICYNSKSKYDFTVNTSGGTRGHIPSIDGKIEGFYFTWWKKKEDLVGVETLTFPVPNPPFAIVDYNSNVRLYHFHIKSKEDWKIKVERGSCAQKTPWYSSILEENKFYGGYDTLDMDMKEQYERNA